MTWPEIDLSTSYPRIITDVLIEEHLVLKASSPCKDLVKNSPVNKHGLQIDAPWLQGNIFKLLFKFMLSFAFIGCENFSIPSDMIFL